jgi:hypothetical protein
LSLRRGGGNQQQRESRDGAARGDFDPANAKTLHGLPPDLNSSARATLHPPLFPRKR